MKIVVIFFHDSEHFLNSFFLSILKINFFVLHYSRSTFFKPSTFFGKSWKSTVFNKRLFHDFQHFLNLLFIFEKKVVRNFSTFEAHNCFMEKLKNKKIFGKPHIFDSKYFMNFFLKIVFIF